MIYTPLMAVRVAIFAFPVAIALLSVELLNRLDASPGVAAIALGFTALVGGSVIGFFADRLPGFPLNRRRHRFIPHRYVWHAGQAPAFPDCVRR